MVGESQEWMNSLRLHKTRSTEFWIQGLMDTHGWVHKEAMNDREERYEVLQGHQF